MGATQSNGEYYTNGTVNPQPTKQCYYELLGVDRQASEDEIKRAYRKKALELHPDRNYGNVEVTTKLFAEVQSAYEILSDPQERRWYDSHRSEILRGDDEGQGNQYEHEIRITTTRNILNMFPKINANREFSNAPSGFYKTVGAIFDTLAREEELACEWEDLAPITYPSFGDANDRYDPMVRRFYTAWVNFATKKTFSWVDIYRLSDAPDRRVRRLMERDNRRLREDAIREFNDAVRSLVAFVKKRDPRFKPTVQTEAERQKALRDAAAAQAARSRAANRAKAEASKIVPQWNQPDEPASSGGSSPLEGPPQVTFECVVCKKSFKSEQQFEAHEKSRKHVKATQRIRREMQRDDENLNLAEETHEEPNPEENTITSNEASDETPEKGVDGLSINDSTTSDTKSPAHGSDQDDASSPKTPCQPTPDAGSASPSGSEHSNREDIEGQHNQNASATSPPYQPTPDPSSTSTSDSEYANREAIENRILGQHTDPAESPPSTTHDSTAPAQASNKSNTTPPPSQPKLGKAKAKRAKKAAAAQKSNAAASADETMPKCITCGAAFASNTKLFNHIAAVGHAQPFSKATKRR